jgi:hypothetical protein
VSVWPAIAPDGLAAAPGWLAAADDAGVGVTSVDGLDVTDGWAATDGADDAAHAATSNAPTSIAAIGRAELVRRSGSAVIETSMVV